MNIRSLLSPGTAWSVLVWMFFLGLLAFVVASVLPKKFEAKTMLMFPQAGAADTNTGRALLSPFAADREGAYLMSGQIFLPTIGTSPNSLIDLLISRAAAEEVATKNGQALFGAPPTSQQLEEFQESVRFEVTENGNLLVAFMHSDSGAAEKVVTDLLAYCDARVRDLTREFARDSLEFLGEEVVRRQSEVSRRSEALNTSFYSSPMAALTGARDRLAGEVITANAMLRQFEVNLDGANAAITAALKALRTARAEGVGGEAYSTLASTLKSQVAEARQKLNIAAFSVGDNSPEMRRLRDEFAAVTKTYLEELDATVRAAEQGALSITLDDERSRASTVAQVRRIRSQVSKLRADTLELADLEIEQRLLARDLERAEAQLDLASSQLAMARIAEEKRYKPFVVLDPVFASDRPVFPRRGLFTAGGIGLGLFIGLFFYIRTLGRSLSGDPHEGDV